MEARKVEYTAVRIKGTETENRVDEEAYGHTVVSSCVGLFLSLELPTQFHETSRSNSMAQSARFLVQ